jgi:hypothetical protein
MTNLRRKRLLLLASTPINHKPYYSQYCKLQYEGLTSWVLGMAFLTDAGSIELKKLQETN